MGSPIFCRELRWIVLPGSARTRDLVRQRLRLDVGRDAQLALQGLGAALVLPERFAAPSGTRIGAHQRALSELRERVEQHQPAAGLDCGIVLAGCVVLRGQSMQDIADHGERAVALRRQPFLKRLGIDIEIGEKFAAVQIGGRLQLRALL